MGKVDYYGDILNGIEDWDDYLLEKSGLPGPRANLELLQAVVEKGNQDTFFKYIKYNSEKAPTNSKYEFLAMCGVVGLGKLMIEGNIELFNTLRMYASDSRWRIREGVAIALQNFGEKDTETLLSEMQKWKEGTFLEQRAVVATLCEPKLLSQQKQVKKVLNILDEITECILSMDSRKDEDFKTLKKALAYGWSVVVVALPEVGKQKMEKWFSSNDKDIIWIMKQNLKKNRLKKMDFKWVERSLLEF
ncbi:hypothetical protein IZY60_07680 [Lutibacter sp. B2]|nr:hypothetical protein [Lutibacter sp. B2]